jgi:hypothetical protein
MRNRKYLSLRVKLLKRQFGLPNDVMSLKSLSISSPNSRRIPGPDLNENSRPIVGQGAEGSGLINNSAVERSSYNGVHRVCPGKDRGPITAVRFSHSRYCFQMMNCFEIYYCQSIKGTSSLAHTEEYIIDYYFTFSSSFLVRRESLHS